jgi:hypothetical protein
VSLFTEIRQQCWARVHKRLRVDIDFVQKILFLIRAEDFDCDRLLIDQSLPYCAIPEIIACIIKDYKLILSSSTHFPSPIMDIGFKLSTLYKFEEYPGPDGASGEVSCNGFDLSRHDTKKTIAMMMSMIPVDAKLIQTAEFLN